MEEFRKLTVEELRSRYLLYSTAEIAGQCGVSPETVRKRLVKDGIPRRNRGGRRTFDPSRDELHALYQEKSMKQIARHYDVGETVVWKRLKDFGIALKDYEDGGHRKKPGRTFSPGHRANISKALTGRMAGENSPRWKGGATDENMRLRRSGAYKCWKLAALELAGYKCSECGVSKGETCGCCGTKIVLHVHHVKSFARFPESRFDPANSEVLCPKCHHSRHHGKIG